MKPGIDLIYKLNGKVDEGINVFELAPILLSVGKIINEAHKTLYPNDRNVSVNIKPFQQGSFEINIVLSPASILQQFLDFVKSDTGQNITLVLAYLGYTSQFSGINLIQLITLLRGKKIRSIESLNSGEVRYNSDDNTSFTVAKEVNALYQNCVIHQNIYDGVARPLESPDVDSIESFIKNDEANTKVTYKKDVALPIKEYHEAEICGIETQTTENIRVIWVRPVTANLEGGSKSWSFRVGEDEKITANITDENFLEAIRGGAKLSSLDRLLVQMKDRHSIRGTNISTSHEIIKVLEYQKGPEQRDLLKK